MSAPPLRPVVERLLVGGVPLCVLTDRSLPLVRLIVAFRGGAWRDPPGRAGLTRLLGELLLRGTTTLNRRQYNAALEEMGSVLGVATSGEALVLRGVCHTRYLARTLELAFAALATSALDGAEREALRAELVAGLSCERDEDDTVAELFLRRGLYGDHPLARSPQGDSVGLLALTAEEVSDAQRALLAVENAVVIVAGDITAAEAERVFASALARLPVRGVPWPSLPAPQPPGQVELWLVDKPERSQVQLRLAAFGPAGREPAALAFAVGVTAFGGTFTSTLTREIRDRRGWSYVAHAAYDRWGLLPAPLVLRSASATADVLDSLSLQLELLGVLARGELDREAVAFARGYLANREPLERQSCADAMPLALRLELLGEPLSRLFDSAERLAALDLDEVGPAMARYLDPARLAVVLVGSATELEAELAHRFPTAGRRTVDFRDGLAI